MKKNYYTQGEGEGEKEYLLFVLQTFQNSKCFISANNCDTVNFFRVFLPLKGAFL